MTSSPTPVSSATRPHLSKVTVAWLALWLGVFGAHWWYLRRRGAWLVTLVTLGLLAASWAWPVWWDSPTFLLLIIPLAVAVVESVVYALMAPAAFDARYNPDSGQVSRMGWAPVIAAVASTIVGSSAVLFMLSLVVLHVWKAVGWLDGYVI